MSSTASNPIATITNNLGYDVDIYDVYNPNPNTSTPGPLTYTLLATVLNGAAAQQVQTIRFASQLQAMYTGNIDALNKNYYQQFPVNVLAVSPFATSNAFTLTSDMQQTMVDTFKFIKYIQANPSSQLATNFCTALGDKMSQKKAINAFFEGTGSFKQCTVTTWTAVTTWQAQFTTPWQGTYYLYSLGGSSAASTTGTSAPALVATLVIAASAQDSSAVLTMAGTNNENTPVVMVGNGDMQEQNPGTGSLSVALTPTWLNINQTSLQSGKTVSNFVIGAAFTGTINGMEVTGNLNQLALPKPSDTSRNANDRNSSNMSLLNTIEGLVGMLTSIGMLYYMAKGHKQAETQKKNDAQRDATSKSDVEEKESQIEVEYQEKDVVEVGQTSEDLQVTVFKVQDAYRGVNQAEIVQNAQSIVEQQEAQLEEILEGGAPSQATEDAAQRLEEARTNLEKATDPATSAADRDVAATKATTDLADTSTSLQEQLQREGSDLSQEEEKALRDTKDALDKVQEQADATKQNERDQDEQNKNDPEEEVNPDNFEEPKAEDPPPFKGEL
ncbi:hypothetical protein FALBO_7580 [Fusarium albosuccineum]|uniref:Uncharacterized protein n=1 Tax=Fusarium albosuccineum TaxID=1237068 RepID=A0A8H4LCL7_9HYPO|nr:hypothetical protein FALBO_7580 [Fusarium albosuccineum]